MSSFSDLIGEITPATMELQETGAVTKPVAVTACAAMALFYVAILYAPTLILRLPPPTSFKSFMIRRFICAAISSVVSLVACSYILPMRKGDVADLLGAYGFRTDHIWQALVFPLSLTSLMYTGSFTRKFLSILNEHWEYGGTLAVVNMNTILQKLSSWICAMVSSVSAWRNYFVAPLTEELVFRACMIPLLLCGGFKTSTVIVLCPVLFSLAHLNHFLECYTRHHRNFLKACMVVGFQLGYTVIFGSYASFLLVRTGHLIAPLVAHIFCNFMGLPLMFSRGSGTITFSFIAGALAFFWLLFPLTSPHLYNDRTDNCKCWHGYCNWS